MVKLDKVIQATIDKLNVDFDNILTALESALKNRNLNGFEVVSVGVISKIKTLVSSLSNEDLHQFYDKYIDDNPELIRSLIGIIVDKKIESRPKIVCDNCRVEEENCKGGKVIDVLPHAGMKFTKGDSVVRTVHTVRAENEVECIYKSRSWKASYPDHCTKWIYACK